MKEAKEFAESIAAIFIETSARNAVNVEELFQKISKCHQFVSHSFKVSVYFKFSICKIQGNLLTVDTRVVVVRTHLASLL